MPRYYLGQTKSGTYVGSRYDTDYAPTECHIIRKDGLEVVPVRLVDRKTYKAAMGRA